MANINKAHRQTFWEVFFTWFAILCMLAAYVLFITFGIKSVHAHASFPGVAFSVAALALVGCIISACIANKVNPPRPIRVRNALADESSKYSTIFMLPITFRVEKRYILSDDPEVGSYVDEVSNII